MKSENEMYALKYEKLKAFTNGVLEIAGTLGLNSKEMFEGLGLVAASFLIEQALSNDKLDEELLRASGEQYFDDIAKCIDIYRAIPEKS